MSRVRPLAVLWDDTRDTDIARPLKILSFADRCPNGASAARISRWKVIRTRTPARTLRFPRETGLC